VSRAVPHALVVDCTEWFLDPAWRAHVTPRHWRRLPSRAATAVALVDERLRARGCRATFVVMPELATKAPERLRALVAHDHELALAFVVATPLERLPLDERARVLAAVASDLARVEAVTGHAVVGVAFVLPAAEAAPVDERDAWWRAPLAALGVCHELRVGADGAYAAIALDDERLAATGRAFAAWRLDAGAPELAGLPVALRRAHAAQIDAADAAFEQFVAAGRGSVAAAMGFLPAPPPVRRTQLPAAAEVEPAAAALPLTIVVPLKDEADGIEALARELAHVRQRLADVASSSFVFVDDGSTDRTHALLVEHFGGAAWARIVRHDHNRGVAAAIRTGIAAADTDLVASIDGDLSYDPLELRTMLRLAADADVVTASPYHPAGSVRNVPRWRLFLSLGLSRIYRVLLRRPIHTWTSCFRVYRRAFVQPLPLENEGFLGTAELLVRVLRRGGRVAEHPCVLEARLFGFSKMRVVRVVREHLGLLWRVVRGRVR
jgi:hypothetical protein